VAISVDALGNWFVQDTLTIFIDEGDSDTHHNDNDVLFTYSLSSYCCKRECRH
jgi:hypothetical protein